MDSECYLLLMNHLYPSKCDLNGLKETDMDKRAQIVISKARKLGFAKCLNPKDIVDGKHLSSILVIFHLLYDNISLILPLL
jgi:hypothetical protein